VSLCAVTLWEATLSSGESLGEVDAALQVSYNSCGRIVGGKTQTLSTNSSTDRIISVTGWVPAIGVAKVKAAIIVACGSAYFRGKLCYRYAATVTEDPAAWQDIDSWHSDGEHNTGEIDISTALADRMWVQFGLRYELSSGSDWTTGTLSAAVSVRAT